MDKVQKQDSSQCITPSSEPFRIDLKFYIRSAITGKNHETTHWSNFPAEIKIKVAELTCPFAA
jgi:hypothetical protein